MKSRCATHNLSFPTPQALGAHNRHHHPKKNKIAKNKSPEKIVAVVGRTNSTGAEVINAPNGLTVEIRSASGYPLRALKKFLIHTGDHQGLIERVRKALVAHSAGERSR